MPTINPAQGVMPYFVKRTVEEYAPIPKKIACPRLIWCAGSTATSSGEVMPPEGAGVSAMEYYRNAAIEKKAVANRFIGLRLILRVGWSMRASGHESR